ncbi:MAG: hypothetical protein LBI42_11970 [Chitinispirillales bacterium]|jgi:ribosomal protein L13E|nr:hypothetical protein [Chitinispirillales bacterium]
MSLFINKSKLSVVIAAAVAASLLSLNSCGSKPTKTQAASARGFETITTPASELEKVKKHMEDKYNIPCGIGIGESSDEMVARSISADEARTDLAKSIGTQVQRLSESYAQNVDSEAKKIWEEVVRQVSNEHVRGSAVKESVVQFNPQNNRYKIYSLVILNPEIFKNAVLDAASSQEEFELRVKKDEMLKKLDTGISEYDAKYRR